MENNEEWLLIGRVVGAHGLNGHVKIYPESDFPERFTKPGERWIKKTGAQPTSIRLTSGRYLEGKNNYLVKLDGIDNRSQAEDLRSAQLMVPVGDRLPLDPGEFHVNDLIGLSAVLQPEQTVLGTITNIFTTGHDLLEVTLDPSTAIESEQSEAVDSTAQTKSSKEQKTGKLEGQPETKESNPSLRAKAARKLRQKAKRQQKKKKPKTVLIPFVEDIVPVVDIAGGRIEITPPPGLINL